MGVMILKVSSEDIEWSGNRNQICFWVRNSWFVVGRSINELLLKIFQLEEQCLRFTGYRRNEEWKDFIDVGDDGFELFSGFN